MSFLAVKTVLSTKLHGKFGKLSLFFYVGNTSFKKRPIFQPAVLVYWNSITSFLGRCWESALLFGDLLPQSRLANLQLANNEHQLRWFQRYVFTMNLDPEGNEFSMFF